MVPFFAILMTIIHFYLEKITCSIWTPVCIVGINLFHQGKTEGSYCHSWNIWTVCVSVLILLFATCCCNEIYIRSHGSVPIHLQRIGGLDFRSFHTPIYPLPLPFSPLSAVCQDPTNVFPPWIETLLLLPFFPPLFFPTPLEDIFVCCPEDIFGHADWDIPF